LEITKVSPNLAAGLVWLCIPVQRWFLKKNNEENEVSNAIAKSIIDKPFKNQRNKPIPGE
jgi:hypothetical protein